MVPNQKEGLNTFLRHTQRNVGLYKNLPTLKIEGRRKGPNTPTPITSVTLILRRTEKTYENLLDETDGK